MSKQQQQSNSVALTPSEVKRTIGSMEEELKKALPSHIPSQKFQRMVITAINNDPQLMKAMVENPRSVMASAMKAAQDGLVPDGREAALVVYNTKDRVTNQWFATAQYLPMVYGLMKKARQSGEIAAIYEPQIVYENDHFIWEQGLEPKLIHTPCLNGDRGHMLGAYAVAKLADEHETKVSVVMSKAEIDEVRAVSKSGDKGPWGNWYGEMAKKTVLKRLCKYLPQSTDLDAAFERDDSFKPGEAEQGNVIDMPAIARPERQQAEEPPKEQLEDKDEPSFELINPWGEHEGDFDTLKDWTAAALKLLDALKEPKDKAQFFENNSEVINELEDADPDLHKALQEHEPFPGDVA